MMLFDLGRVMRLGYLFSRFPVISQTFCLNEILALERQGVEIEIGSIHPPQNTLRHGQLQELRAPVSYAPPAPILKAWQGLAQEEETWPGDLVEGHLDRYGEASKPELRARNALHFARLFRERGVQHFHVHFANRSTHTAIFLRAMSGIDFSITVHGQDFLVDLGDDDLLREMCDRARFIVAVSDYSRALLARKCPGAAEKIFRVHNGVDLRRFAPPAGRRAARATTRVVAVGRLIPFKGFSDLIEAIGALRGGGVEVECEIVGEGPSREELERLVTARDLGGSVRLLGALSQREVMARLAGADVFAMPSLVDEKGASDILPTVILEAMAMGLPVVASRLGGIPEMVEHGETGLLVEPGDRAGLAEAIGSLIPDPKAARRMGRAGRKIAAERFDIDSTAAQLRELFERQGGRAPARERPAPPGWAILCHRWPSAGIEGMESELVGLKRAAPGAPVFVSRLARRPEWDERWDDLAIRLDFLPDAMVIESVWQEERVAARFVEEMRGRLGSELAGDEFFQQARNAIYLAREVERLGIAHLHVFGASALLCAWIVAGLCDIGISATLEDPPAMPSSTVRRMAAGARAVAVGEDRARAWGAPFVARGALARRALLDRLREWSAGSRPGARGGDEP